MLNVNTKFTKYFVAGIIVSAWFIVVPTIQAKEPTPGIYNQNGKLIRTLSGIPIGASVAASDLGKDGIPEIIIGSPKGSTPSVSIFRLDGSKIRSFSLQNVKGKPGVNVAVGDVTGGGEADIVTSFGMGTTPEVRVYNQKGERLSAFNAFGNGFKGGVSIAVGDVTGDGLSDIVATAGKGGGPYVVTFNAVGKRLGQFKAYPVNERNGLNVLVADTNGDNQMDIITSTPSKNSLIKVFTKEGDVQASFRASTITPGNLRAVVLSSSQVIVGTASGSAGLVTSFSSDGTEGSVKFYPYGKKYTAGLTIASFRNTSTDSTEIIVVPGSSEENTISNSGKSIIVDISEQRMKRYENGQLVATHVVSTGKWSMPTPLGNFSVRNKMSTAYSKRYALYMDNWMAFTPDGAYGIHSLPYWRLKNGSIYYEGTNHLGVRVSHGCIRLSPKESAVVFKWANVGTSVTIVP